MAIVKMTKGFQTLVTMLHRDEIKDVLIIVRNREQGTALAEELEQYFGVLMKEMRFRSPPIKIQLKRDRNLTILAGDTSLTTYLCGQQFDAAFIQNGSQITNQDIEVIHVTQISAQNSSPFTVMCDI